MLLLKFTTENLEMGVVYTVLGFAIVMLVLLLITFLLYGFSAVVNIGGKKNKQEEKTEPKEEKPAAVPKPAAEPVSVQAPEDYELVAVITAAIAASLNTTSDKLKVRSIRKVSSWKKEALRQKNNGLI